MKKVIFIFVATAFMAGPHLGAQGPPVFTLKYPGAEFPVQYKKYGTFKGIGSGKYRFKIKDRKGLATAVGSGIFPNILGIQKEPGFIRWSKKKVRVGSAWEFVNTGDPETEFYVWATAKRMKPGARLFFTADALANANLVREAIQAYYAALIHFPGEAVWAADQSFVWYIGPAALSRIESMINQNPGLGYRLVNASCEILNSKDTNLKNDKVIVNPGKWEKYAGGNEMSLDNLKIKKQRGKGKVKLIQYENGHWRMTLNDKPIMVKGVTYSPTPVGRHISGEVGNLWMFDDENENKLADAPYDSWVDANKNNRQDSKEKAVGDFQLLKDMGANAIRIYRGSSSLEYNASEFNKKVLRNLYKEYGISVILGDFLGAYTVGSGAQWGDGTDYTDPVQLENMKSLVRDYVKDHKDEPYVLMWLLGNENLMPTNYSGVNATRTKAASQVKEYLKFVNEVAEMIHKLDPDHPVAVGNLDLTNYKEHAKYAPAIDIFGTNSYRGSRGFGDLWKKVAKKVDRPVLVTEFGCDAYNSRKDSEDQSAQKEYHRAAWQDIALNRGGGRGVGNSVGGIIFEFVDEWWKSHNGPWDTQETTKDSPMAFPDSWSSEEWLGIVSQGDGYHSPFLRQPREVYYLYKDEFWKGL